MRKFLSSAIKIFLAAASGGVMWYFSSPSDFQLIKEQFDSSLPGYSAIKVIDRYGEDQLQPKSAGR